jgi:hypothetical protein
MALMWKLFASPGAEICEDSPQRGRNGAECQERFHHELAMVFSKWLLDGIRRGRIKCSIRFWTRPHVKVGGRYPLGDGRIVVDAITPIELADVTQALARESGFGSVEALLDVARHGSGENIYLIRFHYLRPGAWDVAPAANAAGRAPDKQVASKPAPARSLLQRIRKSAAPSVSRPTARQRGRD